MKEQDHLFGLPSIYFPSHQQEVLSAVMTLENLMISPTIRAENKFTAIAAATSKSYIPLDYANSCVEELIREIPDTLNRELYIKWYVYGKKYDLPFPYYELIDHYWATRKDDESTYIEALRTAKFLEATKPIKHNSEWQLLAQTEFTRLTTELTAQIPHAIAIPSIAPRITEDGKQVYACDDRFTQLRQFIQTANNVGFREEVKGLDEYLCSLLSVLPLYECHNDLIHTLLSHIRNTPSLVQFEKENMIEDAYEKILRHPGDSDRDELLHSFVSAFGDLDMWDHALHAWHTILSFDESLYALQPLLKASMGFPDRLDQIRNLQKILTMKDNQPEEENELEEFWLRFWFLGSIFLSKKGISIVNQPEIFHYTTELETSDFLFVESVQLAKTLPNEKKFRHLVFRRMRKELQALNKGMQTEHATKNILLALLIWNANKP